MSREALDKVRAALERATGAAECHRCGCFHDAVAAFGRSDLAEPLDSALDAARAVLVDPEYDCIGCEECWPAHAQNFGALLAPLPIAACCEAEPLSRRGGWPPLPGEYRVARFHAPVAVCVLHSRQLVEQVAGRAVEGLSIVGAMQTENLGVERVVENVCANPNIRVLIVCGLDTEGRVGHLPGQSLTALAENGVDADLRIVGAEGKRPVLLNVDGARVEQFRKQVELLDRRGLESVDEIVELVQQAASAAPGPFDATTEAGRSVTRLAASSADKLVLDPAGYIVVLLDRDGKKLIAEHYSNDGVLSVVVEGRHGSEIVATLLREGLVTRADHAAYLGRELARAQLALERGGEYRQDAAPGEKP